MATTSEREREEELCVEVVGGRNLPSLSHAQTLEGGRAPRLYVVLKLGKQRARTCLVKATKEPRWDEKFVFKTTIAEEVENVDGSGEVSDAVKMKKKDHKKDHLLLSLFSLDAHNGVAEAALSRLVKGDGTREYDENMEGICESIPMPIRILGRTVVLLHGPDAAPLSHRSANLNLQWLDIIPKSGHGMMYTVGQLGVKIYLGGGSAKTGTAGLPNHEENTESSMKSTEPESKLPEEHLSKEPSRAAAAESLEVSGSKSDALQLKDHSNSKLIHTWKRPSIIDWSTIEAKLERAPTVSNAIASLSCTDEEMRSNHPLNPVMPWESKFKKGMVKSPRKKSSVLIYVTFTLIKTAVYFCVLALLLTFGISLWERLPKVAMDQLPVPSLAALLSSLESIHFTVLWRGIKAHVIDPLACAHIV